ncbi:hypothetical protein JW964_04075 [candidate division KSB1 bacterium]|nr:hypothetical protein [candidate division KSB1 bacterium]
MSTIRLSLLFALIFVLILSFNCQKAKGPTGPAPDKTAPTVQITNPADKANISGTVLIQATASDNIGVTKVEFFVDNASENIDNAQPWEYNWNSSKVTDGSHTITAKAYDEAGNSATATVVTITVKNAFEISFSNAVFTDILINVTGIGSRTIQPGAKETFQFASNPGQVIYSASTSGKTSQGNRVGLNMTWNEKVNVANKSSESVNLIIGPAYFYLYITNSGLSRLTPLYVNWGTVDQTQDNILVPNDNITYNIGYYKAFANTEIRMHLEQSPLSYVFWKSGTHFNFTYTNNQTLTLQNTSYLTLNKAPGNMSPFTGKQPALMLPNQPGKFNKIPENVLNHYGKSIE